MVAPDFLRTTLGNTGLTVFRLGLSATYRPGERCIRRAIDEGVNYFFCYGFDSQMVRVLRQLPVRIREQLVIATGAYNLIWTHQNLRKTLEKRLLQFRTDYIDVFHFLGVTRPADFTPQVSGELAAVRADPRVRAVSLSCHDRAFAAQVVATGVLDCLMARYSAAHRGAETDLFPAAGSSNIGLVSYTATRWGYLIRRTRSLGRDARVPTAGQCYRFVLNHPSVDVCLTAPRNEEQFRENLEAVHRGPLPEDEMTFMRDYGDAVHRDAGWFM